MLILRTRSRFLTTGEFFFAAFIYILLLEAKNCRNITACAAHYIMVISYLITHRKSDKGTKV